MQDHLRSDILFRLKSDFGGKESTDAKYLRRLQCPSCGKKEAFTSLDAPWMIRCGRESKCGDSHHVKQMFPELFDSWTERFAKRDLKPGEKPTGTEVADAYMEHGRGFALDKVQGWYSQETYWDHHRNISSATVRFAINDRDYWERIIDKPDRFGKMKAHFNNGANFRGQAWVPPGLDLAQVTELWIVEGIFDAIALYHAGIAAVAAFSCNNYPERLLEKVSELCEAAGNKPPRLIWALDGDSAGVRYVQKFARISRAAGWLIGAAVIAPVGKEKRDWNDAWQRGELVSEDGELLTKEPRHQGDLVIARSAGEKATHIFNHTGKRDFPFDYGNRLFWFRLNMDEFQKAVNDLEESSEALTDREIRDRALDQCNAVSEIANSHVSFLYYLANKVTDESWYYTRVEFPHDGRPVKNTFSGGQLASASEFKKRLLSVAPGAVWTGSSQQLDRLLKQQISGIKTVETIDFIGYSKEHETWVFPELAVSHGSIYELNDEDYYDIGRMSVKTLSESVALTINSNRADYQHGWASDLANCFGPKGVIALAYWLGSLFAEQIRRAHKSFPFIEIVGEAGSGKSTLIEFLWKLVGRQDYEGFDPSKATLAARARNFAQVSNLPVVLIESDRDQDGAGGKQRQFDWDELKTAYNGRSVRSRGMKNGGNDTYEPPFRGAVVISQNAQVSASDAVLQRIVHLNVTRQGHSEITKALAERLERTPMDQVSGFVLQAATAEASLMRIICERSPIYEKALSELPDIRIHRIAKNHSQIMALLDCLGPDGLQLLPESHLEPAREMVQGMAIERQTAVNADHPMVQEFWEAYDYIEGQSSNATLNHYDDDSLIAVNLKHFEQVCAESKLRIPPITELKRHLKTSRSRKFIDSSRTVRSAIRREGNVLGSATVRCWIFEAEA